MKEPRAYRHLLLVGLLLGTVGYGGYGYLNKALLSTIPVVIDPTTCTANPDQVDVAPGNFLMWNSPDTQYSVHFTNGSPFLTGGDANAGEKHLVGNAKCIFSGFNPNKCYFPYQVLKNHNACGDPGVHVVKSTGMLYWLAFLVGLGTLYFFSALRVRKP
jgi:hypothetical protein